ncbi:MAG: lipo-like protein [Paracoccaceae bacterium]|nr:lipo-like protein [Paracoccaceae bacterium]
MSRFLDALGRKLAHKLNQQSSGYRPFTPSDFDTLRTTLRQGDVLLVEGRERISNAIKYLTQSTWSHAALFVGEALPHTETDGERHRLVEVNVGAGCISAPLSKYESYNTRICRPVGLTDTEIEQLVDFMIDHIGLQYDLRNILDMIRYFVPTPPVPVRWRRRMIAIGSGDPTRAICSTLIAEAFHQLHYPILPDISDLCDDDTSHHARIEIYHMRHYSLFTPRDFDLSPYFEVVKPHLADEFDPHSLRWDDLSPKAPGAGSTNGYISPQKEHAPDDYLPIPIATQATK